MKRLLDTSAVSAFRRGDPRTLEAVRESSQLFLSSVVIGELLFGFRCGQRFGDNRAWLQRFADSPFVGVVEISWETADRYSRVAASLRQRGRPIPTNDVWIAAQAFECGAEILTTDRHFEDVEGAAVCRVG